MKLVSERESKLVACAEVLSEFTSELLVFHKSTKCEDYFVIENGTYKADIILRKKVKPVSLVLIRGKK